MESKGQRWGWEDREGGETGKQEQTLPHSEERSEQKKKDVKRRNNKKWPS